MGPAMPSAAFTYALTLVAILAWLHFISILVE
jgi:hypothetical protein